MNRIRLALVQVNTVVGDLSGNVERIRNRLDEIAGCDLALFPEMTVTGYPLEDLVHKPGFVADSQAALGRVGGMGGSVGLVVGCADPGPGGVVHNAGAGCRGGRIVGAYHKGWRHTCVVFG